MNVPVDARITQRFGENPNNGIYGPAGHTGIDYGCPMRAPVRAVQGGRVTFADWLFNANFPGDRTRGYGIAVMVRDSAGREWLYGHNDELVVALGQQVNRGDQLTFSGATGATGDVHPLRARRVAEALQAMRASDDFQALAVLFKRVKNIAKELTADAALERGLLKEPAEAALLAELDARRPRIERAARSADYRLAFGEIAGLRPPVDRFFTDVFVMVDDERLRTARLKLMSDLRDLILELADISEIIPQTE